MTVKAIAAGGVTTIVFKGWCLITNKIYIILCLFFFLSNCLSSENIESGMVAEYLSNITALFLKL